ncbi:MAG: 3'-5' exonuclease, partial [Methanomicrobiales archaeon HGW-Methanomicrobiales-5]
MLSKINIENILFLDIETVPLHENYEEVDDTAKLL